MLFSGIALPLAVRAQQGQQTPADAISQFLEVTPVRYDLSIPPRERVVRQVTITNKHVAPITLRGAFSNILPEGVLGGVKYTTDKTPYDLASWSTVDVQEFTLPARASRTVNVTLTAPVNAGPGGYYGMLRFQPTERTDLPPVAIQGQIATLFLVRVPGPAKEGGFIKELTVAHPDGKQLKTFGVATHLNLAALVHNEGNVHFSTEPHITVKDRIFGTERVSARLPATNVFPDSDRQFETEWTNVRPGWYTAKVKANLPGRPNAEQSVSFVVLTPAVALIGLGVLVLAIAWLLTRWLRRRRARRRSTSAS